MTTTRLAKVMFWVAIGASCLWLVLTIVAARTGLRIFLTEDSNFGQRGALEIAVVAVFLLQPLFILILIVRAVWLRSDGHLARALLRAAYPLASVVALPLYMSGYNYLFMQSEDRTIARWHSGSITYVCSTDSESVDYDPKTVGPTALRLTEQRHLDRLGDWAVAWPGKTPIHATSFPAKTGSIGGSQGIRWREADGRVRIAYLSFSDLMTKYGSGSIWVRIVEGDKPLSDIGPSTVSPADFTCGPEPNTYRE